MTPVEYWKMVFDKLGGRGKGDDKQIPIDTSKSVDEILEELNKRKKGP